MKKSRLRKRSILKKARDFAVGSAMYLSAGLTPLLAQQGYIRGLFEGEPIPDATVELNGSTATTNEEGYFQFETSVGETTVITIPSNNELSYSVHNVLGRKVGGNIIPKESMVIWNGQNYASGMYFLVAKDADGNLVKTSKGVKFGSENINFPVNLEEKVVTHSSGKGGIRTQSTDSFDEFIVNAPGYFERITFVNSGLGDLINETMVDSGFNMPAYDQIARSRGVVIYGTGEPRNIEGTVRWMHSPKFYIVTEAGALFPSTMAPNQEQIDSVESIIRNDLPVFTQRLVNENTIIEQGNNPPIIYNNEGYIQADSGYVLVGWSNSIGGLGSHLEFSNPNNPNIIQSGIVTLRHAFGTIYRIAYNQELSQVMGARNDSRLAPIGSLFYGNVEPGDPPGTSIGFYSEDDLRYGKFLFERPPGNLSLDTDVRE